MSGSTLQLAKGQHTRGLLLDAAYPLFVNQGYAATSMRQIAEGARLALGGIYNHFPSKGGIIQCHPHGAPSISANHAIAPTNAGGSVRQF